MKKSVIKFDNFTFRYHNQTKPSLININLELYAGEKILIVGRSGSGKSTLLHAINGIIPFAEYGDIKGELVIDEIKIENTQEIFARSKLVGTILQDQDSQFIGLSVGEDVAFSLENSGVPLLQMHHAVQDNLTKVNMQNYADCSPYELSGGQKQCVSLAGVLASSPNILLFDEPLANLDPKSVVNITNLIKQLNFETQKTIIIAEHRIEECLEIGIDRVIVMDKGEIIKIGSPHEVLQSGILSVIGIRQPFYIESLKLANIYPNMPINCYEDIKQLNHNELTTLSAWANNLSSVDNEEMTAGEVKEVLSVNNISFGYSKSYLALNNVTFAISTGEVVSILGNNGAGKSTLTQVISGVYKNSQGCILLGGQPIDSLSIKDRGKEIAVIMQNPNHMIVKSVVWDEVALGLMNHGLSNDDINKQVTNVLKVCGLWGYRNWPVSALSYGQKKRVTIAAMLVLNPQVLILDEPTAGQDLKTYHEFMQFIQLLAKSGLSIIMITHDLYLALEYTTRSLIMHNGEIIADGSPHKLFMNNEILSKANLVEISLSKMAKQLGVPPDKFIRGYILEKKQMELSCE